MVWAPFFLFHTGPCAESKKGGLPKCCQFTCRRLLLILMIVPTQKLVTLHCCFYLHSHASSGTYCAPTTILYTLHSSQVMLWGRQRAERLPCWKSLLKSLIEIKMWIILKSKSTETWLDGQNKHRRIIQGKWEAFCDNINVWMTAYQATWLKKKLRRL